MHHISLQPAAEPCYWAQQFEIIIYAVVFAVLERAGLVSSRAGRALLSCCAECWTMCAVETPGKGYRLEGMLQFHSGMQAFYLIFWLFSFFPFWLIDTVCAIINQMFSSNVFCLLRSIFFSSSFFFLLIFEEEVCIKGKEVFNNSFFLPRAKDKIQFYMQYFLFKTIVK